MSIGVTGEYCFTLIGLHKIWLLRKLHNVTVIYSFIVLNILIFLYIRFALHNSVVLSILLAIWELNALEATWSNTLLILLQKYLLDISTLSFFLWVVYDSRNSSSRRFYIVFHDPLHCFPMRSSRFDMNRHAVLITLSINLIYFININDLMLNLTWVCIPSFLELFKTSN